MPEFAAAIEGTPALALSGVGVTYGTGVSALRDLDLTIPAGSFHAVLGPSGCGKSTMIKVVAGLITPTAGRIDRPSEADFAYVPQGNSCFPWLRAEDNVGYGLRLRGVARTERIERSRALLDELGLAPFARSFPAQLSEGMRQRVAIARAFALRAPLLLMDEPLSALDFQTKVNVQQQLLALWARTGCAILYVTHDIDEALTLADRVSVMSDRPGRVLETIIVPFDRPRSYASIRESQDYVRLFRHLYTLLGQR